MQHNYIIYCILSMALGLFSCHPNRIHNDFQTFPNKTWEASKPVKFEVEIQDTSVKYLVKVNLRYNSAYLFPFLRTQALIQDPQGMQEKREVIFYLTDENGKNKGDVAGDIWDYCCFTLVEPRHFSKGKYHFLLFQTTAAPFLVDVMGIGLEVEKINP